MEDGQQCPPVQTQRSRTCYLIELFLTAQLDFFFFQRAGLAGKITFTQFHV